MCHVHAAHVRCTLQTDMTARGTHTRSGTGKLHASMHVLQLMQLRSGAALCSDCIVDIVAAMTSPASLTPRAGQAKASTAARMALTVWPDYVG
jgi:hypothetical protein